MNAIRDSMWAWIRTHPYLFTALAVLCPFYMFIQKLPEDCEDREELMGILIFTALMIFFFWFAFGDLGFSSLQ